MKGQAKWSWKKKLGAGVGGLLLVLVLVLSGAAIYFHLQINQALPEIDGEVTLSGLDGDVEVNRDANGIPQIVAESDRDLFMAQGFVTAQDRLFQMEMARRQASGELSAIVGEDAIDVDKYFRTLGLHRAAEKSLALYDDDVLDVLQAYADGVNAYIEHAQNERALPFEFTLMGHSELAEWTVVDSLTIGKYMAYDLGGHWERQAFNYYAAHHFDEDAALELFPAYPEGRMRNILEEEYVDVTAGLTSAIIPDAFNGSNNWAVSGEKTASGEPLLADDPHLGLSTPSIWYQVQLSSPTYEVSGVIFAGIPGVILGHNEHLSWGVTNVGPDVQQLYLEERNPDDPYQFRFDDEWEEADVIEEVIEVSGEDPVVYEVVETRHGPVMSEFMEEAAGEMDQVFSLRWTALDATEELAAVLQFNQAASWDEFEVALEQFQAPAQNFVVADQEGTIAYKANGRIPIYEDGDDALLPMPGWDADYELRDYIPFDELPTVVDPEKGFVASANNEIIDPDVYPYHISHVWAQPYRYERIFEVLDSGDDFTVADMQALQMDQENLKAREFVTLFLEYLPEGTRREIETDALAQLMDWDYVDEVSAAAPLIFDRWYDAVEGLLYDVIDEEILELFSARGQTTDTLLREAADGNPGHWIMAHGGLEELMDESFVNAVEHLEDEHGSDVSAWQWGDDNKVYFPHPLSGILFFDRFFNPVEPKSLGGSHVTVQAASKRGDEEHVNHGAGWRFVHDMAEPLEGHHIVGPGQSGHYRSDWYDDQISRWVDGAYHVSDMANWQTAHTLRLRSGDQ
ncbi:penicillin acylase family protein [Salisediminibacterium beveridgei]|uniref:Penicillin acylase II n=1 Tax=Salisediminibacterium beveridgei TaxID=632773 RepID=A0A1D7QRY9_9BACI|nr:penicillin acylase family protein [Salisediminibacterium beveridgei]AOM81782.1 Penicillin acylase II [Salisediminibacterium beveridgei]